MSIQLCIHSVQTRGERVAVDVGIVGGSHRLKEMKKGGGRVRASERDSERRESEHPSELALHFFFFLFCHDSLFNLLSSSSTSSPPSFPFSITGHLHLLIELFCH